MDSEALLPTIAELQAQVQDLEEELADVKQERDDFREDLSRNRAKVAELTSIAEAQATELRDLGRRFERVQRDKKGSVAKTAKENATQPKIVVLKQEPTTEDSGVEIVDVPASLSKFQKPSSRLEPSSSVALLGDYPHTAYPQTYQEQSTSNGNTESWQLSAGTSARIAAWGTAEEQRYYSGLYYQPIKYPASHPQDPPQEQVPRVVLPRPKRRSPDEDAVQPNTKRAKASAPQAPGPSRRRYKRNEAATQSAKPMLQTSHTLKVSEKGKEKATDGVNMQNVPSLPGDKSLHVGLQKLRCTSDKYKGDVFPRCVSCTRRWAGDMCRFQDIRFFLRDSQTNTIVCSFSETQKADLLSMTFPKEWNEELSTANIKRIKITVARALLPTLRKELNHLRASTIHRSRERQVRATCDTCMTSIFSSSWLCRLCGREACAECYATISELTAERPLANPAERRTPQARREKHTHSNHLLQCNMRITHQARDFSPMSRFEDKELSIAIKEMEELLKEEGIEEEAGVPLKGLQTAVQNDTSSIHSPSRPSYMSITPGTQLPEGYPPCTIMEPFIPNNLSMSTLSTPTIPIRCFADSALTQETFPLIWALGEPLVVTDLLHKFRVEWTPEYFIAKYGQQGCQIIECQTETGKSITVGEFFAPFGQYKNRKECWKLKDWPPSTDFKTAFPELYEDFSNALPVPSYVRRDGVLNIASHFPADTVAPDLGPKMYNAMATTQAPGSKGSTRLHMAMADALHIMTYASPAPDGSSGCTAWDIYRAEDSDKLRAFLSKHVRTKAGKANIEETGEAAMGAKHGVTAQGLSQGKDLAGANDPIHGQSFYLDEELRAALYGETGVMSYRFYQRPGDAVFIPAGCAYQVANLADCVTVAVDFVSPENVKRCERLTREFREQNQRKVWKEDVLQLRTMMWFAWLSCRQQEGFKRAYYR